MEPTFDDLCSKQPSVDTVFGKYPGRATKQGLVERVEDVVHLSYEEKTLIENAHVNVLGLMC